MLLDRQCSSGLQACVDVANAIRCDMIEIGIGAGVESMSTQYGPQAVTEFSELLESHPAAAECKVGILIGACLEAWQSLTALPFSSGTHGHAQ